MGRTADIPPTVREALRWALRDWFARHGRGLRFREGTDAWGVLVAEVMAQQTQISRVGPAWSAFMDRFPTPEALASAAPSDVLRAWAGMGYNRRAVNLQRAAAAIVEQHAGRVPSTVAALEALPGVGPYTARAVAAIAFGQPVAAVDTNVRRVVGRLLGGPGAPTDPGVPLSARDLQAAADALVDPADPPGWTHATMDLGSSLCRPARPDCGACPLASWCRYAARSPLAVRAPGSRRAPPATRAPFPSTRRWLRGRIIERLCALDDGDWLRIDGPIGDHGPEAVGAALLSLERDGLLESSPDGSVRLPSDAR